MKKLLLAAALGVAGLMSAGQGSAEKIEKKFSSKVEVFGGYCTVNIYRNNSDGTRTLVRSITSYVDSQEACNSKAASIAGQLAIGISPSNVS